jgi:hypothetical protein
VTFAEAAGRVSCLGLVSKVTRVATYSLVLISGAKVAVVVGFTDVVFAGSRLTLILADGRWPANCSSSFGSQSIMNCAWVWI